MKLPHFAGGVSIANDHNIDPVIHHTPIGQLHRFDDRLCLLVDWQEEHTFFERPIFTLPTSVHLLEGGMGGVFPGVLGVCGAG